MTESVHYFCSRISALLGCIALALSPAVGSAEPKAAWKVGMGCWEDSNLMRAMPDTNVTSCGAKSNTESFTGLISFEVVIDPSGRATSVKMQDSSTLKDPKVAACLTNLIRAVPFPKPAGGSATTILPFRYGPAPEGPAAAPETRLIAYAGDPPIEVVTPIVSKQFGAFNACYNAGKGKTPKLKGTFEVSLDIDAAGKVTASDYGSTFSDTNVTLCMLRAAQDMKFPPKIGVLDGRLGAVLTLSAPFDPDKATQPPKLPPPGKPDLKVTGPLARCQLLNVLDQHLDRFQTCYANAHGRDPAVTGPAVVDFIVDRSGSVTEAKASGQKDASNQALSECAAKVFKELKFAPTAQEIGHVTTSTTAAQGEYVVHFRPGH